mmetsp:Transcript_28468/g.42606  ORF Transcript_28468/g.42606 Transcript_28468/m.42606 type:complete len:112 (+) Transcript_28468:171-506(+)
MDALNIENRQAESSVSQGTANEPAPTTSSRDGVEHHDVVSDVSVSDTATYTNESSPPIYKVVDEEEEGICTILLECAKMSGLEYLFTNTNYITYMTGCQNENYDVLKKEVH